MIGQLRGILVAKQPPLLVIDVAGVGYELQASMTTIYQLPALQESVFLYTHMLTREDAQLLYGFGNEQERLVFRELIKISGLGPKLALAILSGMNVQELVNCIAQNDLGRLTSLPGVGKKTAERLVIEMKDKLGKKLDLDFADFSNIVLESRSHHNDAVSALVSLGYKFQEAQAAVKSVDKNDENSESLIRLALKYLGKKNDRGR